MKTLEKDIKEALIELQGELASARSEPCPDEELLSLYAEGNLAGPEKDSVLEHLSLCPDCLDVVVLVAPSAAEPSLEKVSRPMRAELVEKAKALVEPGVDKMLFDLVVRFFREGLEVIHSSLKPLPPLYQPATVVLRGDQETRLPDPVRMEKSFDNTVAEIMISTAREGVWNVQVLLKGADREGPREGLRVTLKDKRPQRELQSLLVRKGEATFQELPSGEYALEIKDKGALVGELSLCLSKA